MNEVSDTPSPPQQVGAKYEGTLYQLLTGLADAVHRTEGRGQLYLLSAGLVSVILATVYFQIELNAWNQPFYDAIRNRQFDAFWKQLGVFFQIAAVLLFLNVGQTELNQAIRLKLRQMATLDLVNNWMMNKRASRIARAGSIGINPDQRIHEDTRHLTDITTDLGIGLIQSSLLLISFVGVLWGLSRSFVLHIAGTNFIVPGYMVWAALLYAATGSLLSWWIGWPLVGLNSDRYAQEAELRIALVRGSEQADGIALSGSEEEARRGILSELGDVLTVLRKTIFATVQLTFVTAGYGWVALVVPIVVAAPAYFSGDLSFGQLMMVVGAFNQVQQALRWLVDNTAVLADWRATAQRVMDFRQALFDLDSIEHRMDRILLSAHPEGFLAFNDLVVMNFNVRGRLDEPHLELRPGDRVLISGQPATCKTTFFLSIAGLWTWGTGEIKLPPVDSIMFLAQRPFLPQGSLRSVMTYSGHELTVGDAKLGSVLDRTGLGYLANSLDRVGRWDRELTNEEQQQLVLARMLIMKPNWVISDEALDPVSDRVGDLIRSIFENEMKSSAVVNISAQKNKGGLYSRTIRLECEANEQVRRDSRSVLAKAVEVSQ